MLGAGHVPDVRVALADECHVPRRPRDRRDPHLFQGPSIRMIEGPFSMSFYYFTNFGEDIKNGGTYLVLGLDGSALDSCDFQDKSFSLHFTSFIVLEIQTLFKVPSSYSSSL